MAADAAEEVCPQMFSRRNGRADAASWCQISMRAAQLIVGALRHVCFFGALVFLLIMTLVLPRDGAERD